MRNQFAVADASPELISFDALKHLVVSASRFMPKGEVLELADALYDELRERRAAGQAEARPVARL